MDTVQAQNKHWLLPDVADLIFLLVLFLALVLRPDMILVDGSTGWHIVSGNYILQHHCVPTTDIVSYTFAGKAWTAYEWLSDLIMAILVKLGGLTLLEVVAACAIAFICFLLYKQCRDNGANFVLAAVLITIGAIVSSIHWLARPHLFTFFGVYIFATQLDHYYRGIINSKKLAIYLCLYMLIWVNCHPGFLIGLVLIGIYLISTIVEYLFLAKTSINQIKTLSTILVLNIIATLCTPYGLGLYAYISNYLFKTNSIIAVTDEFLSPIFHGALQPAMLEVLFVFFIIGIAITRIKITLPNLLVNLAFAYMALSAQRNMALYVIVALPTIALLYSDTALDLNDGKLYKQLNEFWRSLIAKFDGINKRFTENEKLYSGHLLPIIICIVLIGIAINNGQAFGYNVLKFDFPEKKIPSKNLSVIKQLNLNPQAGLSLDNWGGVLKYKLDYPVFIDDRADFYGERFYNDYGIIIQALPGWQKLLDKYKIDWILLPRNNHLVEILKTDNNWQQAGEDQASVLIVRKK